MGTVLHHIAGSLIRTVFKTQIVQFLLPLGQFGVAIHGRLCFMIRSIQSTVDCYISNPQTATYTLLVLDFKNFFNEVSRKACEQVLAQELTLSPILHYFTSIYAQPN
jgi:hypothetical protein